MTKRPPARSAARALALLLAIIAGACRPLSPMEGSVAIPAADDMPATAAAVGAPTARTAEWVFLARNEVIYLRWSAPGGAVAGVMQTARRSADGTGVRVTSGIVAGAANGPHVVLRTGRQTWSGSIDGDNLVLAVTRPDGARNELQFARGSLGEFDAAVAKLRASSTTTVTRSRRAAATTTTSAPPRAPPHRQEPILRPWSPNWRPRPTGCVQLRATDAAVNATENALDAMYQAADAVYAALGRPRCAIARDALARLDATGSQVEQGVAAVDQAATRIEEQRAVVMDEGLRVVALDDPALNDVIVGTNDELAGADTAIAELRRYAGEVRSAVGSTAADAGQAVGARC